MRALAFTIVTLLATDAQAGVCNVRVHDSSYDGTEVMSWSVGTQRLVLCSYHGYPLEELGKDRWLVSELFAVVAGPKGSQFLLDVPSDAEAEFVVASPTFVFTTLTYRSESEPRVPLLRHEVALNPRGNTHRTFFVLQGKPFSKKRFREHLRKFQDAATTSEQREGLLYLMRDEGASSPREALRLLADLEQSPYADGHIGEELSAVIGELRLARDIAHRASN